MNRRFFLTGLAATIAAPAVVRAASLMPVRGIVMATNQSLILAEWVERLNQQWTGNLLYGNPEFSPVNFSGFTPLVGPTKSILRTGLQDAQWRTLNRGRS